jgi:hypothetical protein
MRAFILLVLAILLSTGAVQAGQTTAGVIKSLDGKAIIQRDGRIIPAEIGTELYVSDTVVTEKTGSAGIMLEDDTLISMGYDSRLELSDYAFEPQHATFAIALKFLKGSFAYMSGIIGRLAPEKIRIETPDAVIAVHGTRFLANVEGIR